MSRSVVLIAWLAVGFTACAHVPPDLLSLREYVDPFDDPWFGKHFEAAGEKPIEIPASGIAYRFTWLRSFDNPVIVRIECDVVCTMTSKRLSGEGGYEPGEIAAQITRDLSPAERDRLQRLFASVHFWRGPPGDPREGWIMDGAAWILEAAMPDAYEAWTIQSPMPVPVFEDFVRLCSLFIDLSGFEIPPDRVY